MTNIFFYVGYLKLQTQTNFKNHESMIQNINRQVRQSSRQLTERPFGSLLSDTFINLKEQCKAVKLRSGKELPNTRGTTPIPVDEKGKEPEKDEDIININKDTEPNFEIMAGHDSIEGTFEKREKREIATPNHVPYPQLVKRTYKEMQFVHFVGMFKKMNVKIPLV